MRCAFLFLFNFFFFLFIIIFFLWARMGGIYWGHVGNVFTQNSKSTCQWLFFFLTAIGAKRQSWKNGRRWHWTLGGESNVWAMSDVKSDGEGGVVYRTPIWRTEEANELIRCDLSINKTRCYMETSEQGTSRVHRDIISEDTYLG